MPPRGRGGKGRGGDAAKAKGGGRGRAKKTQEVGETETPEREDREDRDVEEGEDDGAEMVARDQYEEEEEEERPRDDDDEGGECWNKERQEGEERIADFYEARPYFFDKKHEQYKNKKKQRFELQKLSKELIKEVGSDYTGRCW